MFENITAAPADPILGLADLFRADERPGKINLGIGVYKDETGKTPVLTSVKKAEQYLLENETTKNYLGIDGIPEFGRCTQELLFGKGSALINDKRARTDTRLHLAFSSWLFNAKGQLLVTRRALSKKAWPGVWTNSVCGHPQLGESNEDAVIRRCRYELGVEITPPESIYPDFRYRATDPSGIVENEVCPVFAARTTSALQINDDEVMDYQWCDLADVLHGIDATPWAFSPWMVMQAANSEARKLLSAFAQHN